ncbi:MAG: polysaccharide deacetylase family protein, partial [Candidatus Margulisiibacteriota bacterium]
MQQEITIIMYHYVRELAQTPYPSINALLTSEFKSQLEFLRKNYNFVTIQDCINAIYHQMVLPPNPCLLTFDDGYVDHLTNVFPLLNQYKIQGSFFPPAKAILEHKLLDVNKIHFLLASMNNRIDQLIKQIFLLLDNY